MTNGFPTPVTPRTGQTHESAGDAVRRSATTTTADRRAFGAERRRDVPLDEHARVPTDRGDPVAILTGQDTNRLASLVPIRHGRMSASAFTFYRGAAAVMADDLATVPSSGLWVQLCGDAHLSNFGVFNGPDRRLVFDVNDFDETLPGPFEWDVKRLAASMVVAARANGLGENKARRAALAAVAGYRDAIAKLAVIDPLELYYFRLEVDEIIARLRSEGRKHADKLIGKARRKNSLRAVSKLTTDVDGHLRFVDDPPLVERLPDLDDHERADIRAFFEQYLVSLPLTRRRVLERYRTVDVARKVVGVGSVGTRCLILLCTTADGDPLVLQFKEATASVLESALEPSAFDTAGERVVQGQRLMQAAGDVFLGWSRFTYTSTGQTADFYFRQLWDGKGSWPIDELGGKALRIYGDLCGRTLALAHARTGDAAAIDGYLGDDATFDEAVADFSEGYADLTDDDHRRHLAAIDDGTIDAIRDI